MTSTGSTTTDLPVRPDEVTAVHGARWITVSALGVGVLNYAYALVLTRVLDVDAYATFAAGQGLVLCAATVAVVAIPWVLAQSLARARTQAERGDAVRFAVFIGTVGGILATGAVTAVAVQFAEPATTLVLAASTMLIYVTTVSVGWLQGTERMRTLACVHAGEAVLKLVVGLLLVSALGLSDTGALAALGIAVLPFLIWWPHRTRGSERRWLGAAAHRDLWRRALGIASVQGMVALIAAIDVVLVTALPAERSAAASYQASVMIGRIPLFVAGAISMAFFPALARRKAGTPLAASAVRMYLTVALPFTAICATAPAAVLTRFFPSGYGLMSTLLVFTAVSGFAVGALNLVGTFCQAVDDYRCLGWQCTGVVGCVVAVLIGWRAAGVVGLAAGAACGSVFAAALLVFRLVHRQGIGVFARLPLVEPLVLAGVLILLAPLPRLWLVAATAVGVHAAARFFRHRGAPEAPVPSGAADVRLVTDAVWLRDVRPAGAEQLRRALTVARRNQVEGRLARAYPGQLGDVLDEVNSATELFRRNLCQVTDRLRAAGIPTVLIKADLSGDYVYGNFDLVVHGDQWRAADAVLSDWYTHRERYWLERSSKVLLEPPLGPAAHLHTAVSWFGVPVVPTDRLFAGAVPCDGHGWLVPNPADRLRIWLAHGLFQNLTFDLSELLAVRELLQPDVVAEAQREASREGWPDAGRAALASAAVAIGRLDCGQDVRLPLPLPVSTSLRAGAEHARHLLRQGQAGTAVREAALRVPLVLTKKLRRAAR
ncbi:lipopolysaccharide biosynthesis protein [Streptomyces sp. NPDC005408]|uniref:lipopolysaccharide biosynthesis protein n=1 Tax=Streptomyces sp. NPDC005408 TaxID=3155341 RepID=UPI0033BCE333